MAIEKNPNDISTPLDKAKEKVQAGGVDLGINVDIKEEQDEDLAVSVDPLTGEVEMDLNEDSGKVLASISEDFYTNLADLMEETVLLKLSLTLLSQKKVTKMRCFRECSLNLPKQKFERKRGPPSS